MEKSFAQLLKERIDREYGGSQAEFARRTGFTKQAVGAWLKGKVSLPQLDARRRLARELGISHIDLLVAVGELDASEVAEAGVTGVVGERPVDFVHEVVDSYSWDEERAAQVVDLLAVVMKGRERG
jgi:transcriptional regulator with XRE-family HTH domain